MRHLIAFGTIMIQRRRALQILLAIATLAGSGVHAATPATQQIPPPDRVQEMNDITFVSGGIGADSRDSLAQREQYYNFKLVLTLEGAGTFVSDARVTLSNAEGETLVEHTTEGPLFLASMPAGTYVVSARFRNMTVTRKFQVRADRLHTEQMRWPADPSLDVATPPEAR